MKSIGFTPDRQSPNRKQRRAERFTRREISEGIEQAFLLWHEENFEHLVTMFLIQMEKVPNGYDRFLSGGFAELAKAKAGEVVQPSATLTGNG
jgi:hypothetical protein